MSKVELYISNLRSQSADYSNLKLLSEKLVIFFLKYWLLIDMANGYLMRSSFSFPGGISLGEISRIIFLILILISFKIKINSQEKIFIALPFILIGLSVFQHLCFDSNLVTSINTSVKLCLPILIYLFIKEKLSNRKDAIIGILKLNSIILVFNLTISLFGFGFFTYGARTGINFGGKGYFFAGNEVSIVILVTYSLLVYVYRDKQSYTFYITTIYLIISLVSLTRASIFGVLLVFIISVIIYNKKNRVRVLSVSIIFIGTMIYMMWDYIMLAVNRAIFFIENTSMLIFMTGGHKRWEEAYKVYQGLLESPLLLFTGIGWTGRAEQDLVDLISSFGISGVLIYMVWLYFAAYAIKNQDNRSNKIFITFIFILVFGVATLAGHVMTSAMLAPFVAILANIHLLNNTKQQMLYLMQGQ